MRLVDQHIQRLAKALRERYTIQHEIGRGGMATVHLADDLKHARPVAIKVLRPEFTASLMADRFLFEITTAARLQHPHILPLFDSGQDAGQLFYVMPFVPDGSLAQLLRREKQLALEAGVRFVCEVAEALNHAHLNKVVHRDIKPENVMLVSGHAQVADFGIARAIDQAGADSRSRSAPIGTPAYMSPEQMDGVADGRSDLYSLACVLFELLAGEPPYHARTTQHLLALHAKAAIPSLQTLRPTVPPALDEFLYRALAKNPVDRFATAAKFREELERAATGRASDGGQPARPAHGARASARPAERVAVLPFVDASEHLDQEYFADGMTEALIAALTKVARLRVVSRTSVFSYKGSSLDVREIGHRLEADHVLEGTVRTAGERLRVRVTLTNVSNGDQLWTQLYDRSITDVFATQDEIAQSVAGALRIQISANQEDAGAARETESVEAYRCYLQGRHFWNRRFEGGLQKAIECFQQALEHDPLYARAYSGLADCFLALGTYEFLPAHQAFPRAIAAARKALEVNDQVAEAHASHGLATMYYHHDWPAAGASLECAMALDPEYASARQYHGIWLAATGRLDAAVTQTEQARALDHLSPIISACVGWMLYFAGRQREAIESLLTTLKVHPAFGVARGMLGQAYLEAEQFDDAIRELRETSKTFPPAFAALGHALGVAGRTEEALGVLAELDKRAARGFVSAYSPAIVYAGLDDRDHAFEWLNRAYEERSIYIVLANVNPMFRRLRADSRFDALLRKLRLK